MPGGYGFVLAGGHKCSGSVTLSLRKKRSGTYRFSFVDTPKILMPTFFKELRRIICAIFGKTEMENGEVKTGNHDGEEKGKTKNGEERGKAKDGEERGKAKDGEGRGKAKDGEW